LGLHSDGISVPSELAPLRLAIEALRRPRKALHTSNAIEDRIISWKKNGAARGNRTHDLSLTKGVLYH
jgi:hypothetical protein